MSLCAEKVILLSLSLSLLWLIYMSAACSNVRAIAMCHSFIGNICHIISYHVLSFPSGINKVESYPTQQEKNLVNM